MIVSNVELSCLVDAPSGVRGGSAEDDHDVFHFSKTSRISSA